MSTYDGLMHDLAQCFGVELRSYTAADSYREVERQLIALIDARIAAAEARDVGQQVVDAFHEVYGGLERLSEVRAARLDPATCPHAHVTSEETASLETERHTCLDCGAHWYSELPQ